MLKSSIRLRVQFYILVWRSGQKVVGMLMIHIASQHLCHDTICIAIHNYTIEKKQLISATLDSKWFPRLASWQSFNFQYNKTLKICLHVSCSYKIHGYSSTKQNANSLYYTSHVALTARQSLHEWDKVVLEVWRGVLRCYGAQGIDGLVPDNRLLYGGKALQGRLKKQQMWTGVYVAAYRNTGAAGVGVLSTPR